MSVAPYRDFQVPHTLITKDRALLIQQCAPITNEEFE